MRKTAFSVFVLLLALSGFYPMVQAQNSAKVVIDAYPNNATVEQGTTLVLVCRVVGVPSTTVLSYQWTCPGGSCDAGAVDPEWAAKVQQDNILVVNVRNGNDTGDYTCTVMGSSTPLASLIRSVTVTNGLSFLNEDGGLRVFFPRNSFVTNTTLTITSTPRNSFPSTGIGNDHIACYGGDPKAPQVTWHNSSGPLAPCLGGGESIPCQGCGPVCENNGAVGVDPSLSGHTSIHLFTNDPNYVNQDLQCRVNGGQSALIGVYLMNGASTLLVPSMVMTSGATTTTTVSVSWSPVSGATGYYVSYQRQDLGTPPVVTPQYKRIVGGASTSVTLSGLEPGTTYRIRVWSTDGTSVSSEAREVDVTTMESAPSAPRMLTVTGRPSGSTVELNWLPPLHPNGDISYEIEYEPAMTPGFTVVEGGTDLYFNLTLPKEFLTYNVRVVAVSTEGSRSGESNTVSVCPGRNRQGTGPPTDVMVEGKSCNSANVNWTAPKPRVCDGMILGYNVRYRVNTGNGEHTTENTSTTSVMLQGLVPNTEYSVEVAAITSVGTVGPYSSESLLTITGPRPPTDVSATVTGCDSAEVTWMASISMFGEPIMNYSVTYQTTSGGVLTTVNSPSTSDTLQGLVPNAEYNVSVAGINSCGGASAFTTPLTFVLQDPDPPTGVLATMGTECNTSDVSWNSSTVNYNAMIANYSVRYQLRESSGDYTTVFSTTASVTLMGLDPSAEYDVEVAAIDLCGRMSKFSDVAQLNLKVPARPTGVMVEEGTGCYTSVVSWTAPQSMCGVVIGNYSVRYRLTIGGGNYTTMYTDGTRVTLGNITANAAYDVSVAAISSQIGLFTEERQFKLEEPKPPTDVTFRVTGTDSVMVSWTASLSKCGGMTNYSVTYQLTSGTGPTNTVYTTETSITLQGLIPNGEYNVMVSATNSMGDMSAISDATPFTVRTPSTPTGDDSTVIIIVAVIIVILVVVAVIAVAVIIGVCCFRRKTKGKLYEPAVRASKPASSSTGQYDNMYAEVRETNGQPEKPPIEFDGGAASTADYDYAVVPKAATEEAPGQPQSTPFVEHQYATVSKDGSLKPQGSSPHPLPKAHHKTPPPKPSPFSGKSGKVEKSAVNDGAFDAFLKQVESMHAQGKASFEAEYNSVDKSTAASIAMAELNNAKNRYKNIFPYDSSRVPLSVPNTSGTDYINASFIDGYKKKDQYIASQAPVPDTVDDFWQMIWDQKMNMVVMLTKTMEGTKRKSEDYYPESPGDTFSSGRFQIRTISLKYHVDYEVRVLEVAQASNPSQTRTLDHYLFTGWPDYGVPKYPTSLIRMLYHVRDARVLDVPTLVHCSAGVGRSGTFIALDIILDQMNAEQKVDVKGTMQKMREKRMYMIQTVDQYTFVYDAVRELLMLGDTTIKASELRKAISQLKVSSGTGYQQQFASLNTLTQESADDEKVEVDSAVIRYPERAPIKGKHLYISKPTVGGPVMQNASFVDGYHAHRAFIAAQSPLQSTVTDFWTLIAEKKVQTVLLLCPLVEDAQETCHAFWPHTEGGALDVGSMKVILLRSTATSDFDTLQFTIQKPRSTQDVTLLHYKQWPEKRRPKSASFLKLFTSAQKLQQPHSNKPILVACNDGLGRTGTFIAIWSLIEQMKAEGQIDVVSTVKSIRIQRPGAMPLMDQFVYCHDLLLEYVDSFEGYSNFSI